MITVKHIAKLDAVFSKYIRLKHSRGGIGRCYTCGKFAEIKNLQCGHFHSRKHLALRWDESNCRPQCVTCNMFMEGNKIEYTRKLTEELGQEAIDMLNIRKNNFWKPTCFELELLTKEYQAKLNELSKVHG
jgi:hypothetical protein